MVDSTRHQIFISYSHKDNRQVEELKIMLKGKFQDESILLWDDSRIRPGEKWEEEINKGLSSARVVVLLVTNNFLASEFIMKKELPHIITREKEGVTKVTWIYWGHCNYEGTELEKYQALNELSRPLSILGKAEREGRLSEIVHNIYMMRQNADIQ